ncbi:MAG TPA: response regulator transcription factor [Candidatus Tenderia electrophaga]|uniref:Response regulator transcription factor n=1 Tax=Candidatus Tenderia electrophaga TaxID=1748243 RepID=A0A832N5L4_9GAMM|nr:response regulator transcription factor [Candidatus Tenderia electrophaga]
MRLLLVEDDVDLGQQLKQDLVRSGFAVDLVDNGLDAEFMGDEEAYDLVVLDLGLPQRPGLEVLQNWRSRDNKVPVVILTARDAWHEKVDGFKAGADDYLAKPFHIEELLMRIQAVIRRNNDQTAGDELKVAQLSLDEERQTVTTRGGEMFELTGTEFRLLRYFMLHPGRILSKSVLTEHVYDYDSDKDSNVIEVYINRLRQKLGKELIQTKRGQGYIFKGNET